MSIARILSELAPTPASYLKAAREIHSGAGSGLRPLKLAVLSTFSAQFLEPFLVVAGAQRGWGVRVWFGGFGELETAADALAAEAPEVVVVLARLEELAPALLERGLSFSAEESRAALAEVNARLRNLTARLRERTDRPIFVANFAPPLRRAAGLAEAQIAHSPSALANEAGLALADFCRGQPDVFVFDYARLVIEHGLAAWFDARLFHLARLPFGVSAQIALGQGLVRQVRAALVAPAKVLALDLDNTLWGGVVGEDGVGGLQLGEDYPGNAFRTFQKYLRTLKDRGILLAIASKNNEAEALDALENHPDGVLRRGDFAALRIDWREKSVSLREIAEELDVGLESVVFFDDNPVERAEIRRHLPMVTVIEPSASPLEWSDAVEASGAFDQLMLTREDRGRTALYRQQEGRSAARREAPSLEDFLTSLEMVATVGAVDAVTLPRVAQLLAKTNQFNLTTRRHTAAELAGMMDAGAVALWLRLADRFGDNGLVGVAVACRAGESWRIDTLLLSCRVIGRGAEDVLLAQLAAGVAARGGRHLIGEYLPTAKNGLVADFLERHGFERGADHQEWRRDLQTRPLDFPSHIRLELRAAGSLR